MDVIFPNFVCSHDLLQKCAARIDCNTGEYRFYQFFGLVAVALWPIGFPAFCVFMLYKYEVPQIAAHKVRLRRFENVLNTLSHCNTINALPNRRRLQRGERS